MSWKHFITRIDGKKAQVLLDTQFRDQPAPTAQLPNLMKVTVFNQMDPCGALWHPDEAGRLEKVEESLMKALEQFGNGWAVYVRRVATEGVRTYDVYFGDAAKLSRAAVVFKEANPTYRIEAEFGKDETWAGYLSWVKEAPPV